MSTTSDNIEDAKSVSRQQLARAQQLLNSPDFSAFMAETVEKLLIDSDLVLHAAESTPLDLVRARDQWLVLNTVWRHLPEKRDTALRFLKEEA